MPCATRGPAHKLCRSLPIARTRKGIHPHAPPPPLPRYRNASRTTTTTTRHCTRLAPIPTHSECCKSPAGPAREYTLADRCAARERQFRGDWSVTWTEPLGHAVERFLEALKTKTAIDLIIRARVSPRLEGFANAGTAVARARGEACTNNPTLSPTWMKMQGDTNASQRSARLLALGEACGTLGIPRIQVAHVAVLGETARR